MKKLLKRSKSLIAYAAVFVPLWMAFCAVADFVIQFEARAYTMAFGVIAFLVCNWAAGSFADKFE